MVLAISAGCGLRAQDIRFRPPPNLPATGRADQADGARILGEFRQAGIAGTYWLAFDLRVMPRRGADRVIQGEMFGTRGPDGPLTRLAIGNDRWLVQGGAEPAAWLARNGGTPSLLSAAETLAPIDGTDLAVFDLQMPFLAWRDFIYEGPARIRSRPANSFILYPPAELAASRPDLTGIRILIDTQFQALVQAEVLGPKGKPEKTTSVLDLKKTEEQWIVKSVDLRNNLTRDKTRFIVTAAALGLDLPPDVFLPESLSAPPPTVPPGKIDRF